MADIPEVLDSSITPASLRAHAEYLRKNARTPAARDLEKAADLLEKQNARVSLAEHLAQAYIDGMRDKMPAILPWEEIHGNSREAHLNGIRFVLEALTKLNSSSREARREWGVEYIVNDLTEALRLTVEYVGYGTLPAVDTWHWFAAMKRYAPDVAARMEKEYEAQLPCDPNRPYDDAVDGYCTCYPDQRGRTLSCGIAAHRERAAREGGRLPPETDENPNLASSPATTVRKGRP